jgi:ATP-binding cassette, subfamily C, bacterial
VIKHAPFRFRLGAIEDWRIALGELRPYVLPIAGSIVLFVTAIVLETLALVMLGPLLDLATGGGVGVDTDQRLFHIVFGGMSRVGLAPTLIGLALVVVGLLVSKSVATILGDYLRARVVADYERVTRVELATGLLRVKWHTVMGKRIGDLLNVMTLQTDRAARGFVIHLLLFLGQAIMALTYIAVAVAIIPLAGVGIAVLLLLLGLSLASVFRSIGRWSQELVNVFGDLTQRLAETVGGLKILKALTAEQGAAAAIQTSTDRVRDLRVRTDLLRSAFSSALEPALILALLTMVVLLAAGVPNVALVGFVGILLLRAFQRVFGATLSVTGIVENLPSVAAVADIRRELRANAESVDGESISSFGTVELRDLRFVYPDGQVAVEGVNLTIEAGDFVGIVGASGAGKSTILDLVMGLIPPTGGDVLVDGRPLRTIAAESWRRLIGYVPQETVLFNDTVGANIMLYRREYTPEELDWALKVAQIERVISQREGGLNVMVGDRGTAFSGGERQRLALARAILGKPRLLVLDEATSSLDGHSERAFQSALEAIRGQFTIIVVAHRLSAVMGADRVIVMENGCAVEAGPPRTLIADSTTKFAQLHGTQRQTA